MKKMLKHVVVVLAAAGLVSGCASSPDVPEQTEMEKRSYRSTEDGEEGAGSESADASGAEQGGTQQGDKTTPRGTGGVPKATGPVATVNGESIPAEEFNIEMMRIANSGQFPKEVLPQFADRIVESVVDKHLIQQQIEKSDIEVSDEEVAERIERLREEYAAMNQSSGGGEDATLDKMLEQMNITKAEFEDSVAESIKMERLLEKRGMEMPGEEEAKEFYEENQSKFEQPAQVRARHILIKVPADAPDKKWEEAFAKIQKIRKTAVAEGTDFAELAEEKSEGPSASRGGDLGYFGKGQMVPEFENTVFSMQKDEVSEPIKTQFGWHVIKLVDKREAGPVPFEKVEDRLNAQLKNQAIQNSMQELVAELRDDADVELHLDNIE
ncbi:MAG: peptidylprolyl isomerase [Myxococcota bacterium]